RRALHARGRHRGRLSRLLQHLSLDGWADPLEIDPLGDRGDLAAHEAHHLRSHPRRARPGPLRARAWPTPRAPPAVAVALVGARGSVRALRGGPHPGELSGAAVDAV